MNYMKKMCILRQSKQGFSGDGKTLSGLVKVEQYGKNIAIEVSIINFAPLVSGEYYCLLSDIYGKTELLPLRGKSLFNILSDMNISEGFCAIICFIKNEIIPIAYGVNGHGNYDWKKILNATLPPSKDKKEKREPTAKPNENTENPTDYNDETLATENYYMEEEDEQVLSDEAVENAQTQSTAEKEGTETGLNSTEDVDAQSVRHSFTTDSDGYYRAVKGEIDELLKTYPEDKTLNGAFSCSEWVRVKGEADSPQYLVGIVYDDGKAKYICYALVAEDKNNPPEEIKEVCSFVPVSPFDKDKGFFVIFQSAATGECIKPTRA